MFNGPQDPDLFSATSLDLLLDSRSKGLKYGLMRRLFDPLPQPVTYFGQHPRWLKRDVLAWLERQINRPPAPTIDTAAARCKSQGIPVAEAKARYERGSTLDQLCSEYQIGKARLLKLLREAGTQIRPPGKRSNSVRHAIEQTTHAEASQMMAQGQHHAGCDGGCHHGT